MLQQLILNCSPFPMKTCLSSYTRHDGWPVVQVCLLMYICLHTCARTHTHTHTHTHIHTLTRSHTHTHTHSAHTHTHTHTHTYTHKCTLTHSHTHTHTHTHTQSNLNKATAELSAFLLYDMLKALLELGSSPTPAIPHLREDGSSSSSSSTTPRSASSPGLTLQRILLHVGIHFASLVLWILKPL